jgi:mannosyltransferase OCH1-like enzyme
MMRNLRALKAGLQGELPLRRVDWLRTGSPSGPGFTNHRIPLLVHQTWSTNRFGRTHAKNLNRFRQNNPEMTFRLWSDNERDNFVVSEFGDHAIADIYFRAAFGPLAVDIWRYLVLLRLGGWYFDINKCVDGALVDFMQDECEMLISFEKNFMHGSDSASTGLQHPENVICNWGMAAMPNHPVMARVINDICMNVAHYGARIWVNPKDAIIDFTGPRRLTRAIQAHANENGLDGVCQAGIDFHGKGVFNMPKSWVRYITNPPYAESTSRPILS